jgi:hypothetical protein
MWWRQTPWHRDRTDLEEESVEAFGESKDHDRVVEIHLSHLELGTFRKEEHETVHAILHICWVDPKLFCGLEEEGVGGCRVDVTERRFDSKRYAAVGRCVATIEDEDVGGCEGTVRKHGQTQTQDSLPAAENTFGLTPFNTKSSASRPNSRTAEAIIIRRPQHRRMGAQGERRGAVREYSRTCPHNVR